MRRDPVEAAASRATFRPPQSPSRSRKHSFPKLRSVLSILSRQESRASSISSTGTTLHHRDTSSTPFPELLYSQASTTREAEEANTNSVFRDSPFTEPNPDSDAPPSAHPAAEATAGQASQANKDDKGTVGRKLQKIRRTSEHHKQPWIGKDTGKVKAAYKKLVAKSMHVFEARILCPC